MIDEYSRECLAAKVTRRLPHHDALDALTKQFVQTGVPVYIRSDNGAEFTEKRVRSRQSNLQIKLLFIKQDSPWGNESIKPFNGEMKNTLLDGEIF